MRVTDLDFAFASCLISARVSSDHRPPTSAARTTRRARAWSPESSGYLRCFSLRGFQARELSGLQGRLDWAEGPWRSCTLLQDSMYQSKCTSSRILFHVLVANANRIQHREIWEHERISYFVTSQEYRELCDIAGESVVFE